MHTKPIPPNRNFAVPLVLILLLQLLAGCAPAITKPPLAPIPTTVPTQPPAPTEIPLPTATVAPSPTPFVPKATIKIVVHVPLSGSQSEAGIDLQRAAEMAVEELAAPLNDLGYAVTLVPYDDKNDIDTAAANAKEIVADPEVLCGVGHYTSNLTIQTSEIYHRAGLPFVSPSSTNATVTDRGYLEVDRVVGRLDLQGTAGAQLAKSLGISTVYIIQPSSDPFKKNAEYFKREADRTGVKVVGVLTTDVSDDFSAVITRLMPLKPDAVYFAGMAGQAGPFYRQARAAGYNGVFIGIDSNPQLGQLAGPLLIEGGGTYYIDTVAPVGAYPGAAQFATDFTNLYGAAPHPFAAQAYDAAGVCLKGIEEASKAKGGELPTRTEVAKAIRALQGYAGITGTFSFNKKGDAVGAEYLAYKVLSADPANWSSNQLAGTFTVPPPQ